MYQRITLDNGIRMVCEKIPYMRSVSIGIWVANGSANENRENNGISHYIEHMLFKGTNKRSAKEIAESIDNIGGQINAFTGKDCTCYYTKTLDTHMDIAFDVLSDMFFNSKFDKKDMDLERNVIIEEISMYEDSPEELAHDMLSETVWNGNSLGYPILGDKKSLGSIDSEVIKDYIKKNYTQNHCVISVAGNYDIEKLTELVNRYFGSWEPKTKEKKESNPVSFISNKSVKEKDIEQIHLCMGFEGLESGNDDFYTLLTINNVLGGGMSSRLFQRIREQKGLVYSIYSFPSSYKSAGLFTIYAGMNPENLNRVTELISDEISKLIKTGISKDELEKSKEQLKGNYILGLESTSSRMNSIGKSELILNRIYTPQQVLKKIDKISIENVEKLVKKTFDTDKRSISVVGNIKKSL
ncbi:MAG: pitrilysin family protein [Clostridia bacterium]|jgi:predicted Zn-dependent peptidase